MHGCNRRRRLVVQHCQVDLGPTDERTDRTDARMRRSARVDANSGLRYLAATQTKSCLSSLRLSLLVPSLLPLVPETIPRCSAEPDCASSANHTLQDPLFRTCHVTLRPSSALLGFLLVQAGSMAAVGASQRCIVGDQDLTLHSHPRPTASIDSV